MYQRQLKHAVNITARLQCGIKKEKKPQHTFVRQLHTLQIVYYARCECF